MMFRNRIISRQNLTQITLNLGWMKITVLHSGNVLYGTVTFPSLTDQLQGSGLESLTTWLELLKRYSQGVQMNISCESW